MQYRQTFVILAFAVSVAAPAPLSRAQSAPATESPQAITHLQNFGTMVAFLNLASGTVRLIAILEPSSAACDPALQAVQSVLDASPSKRLRAYVVWTRLSEHDTELRAAVRANQVHDRRLVHFWDGEGFVVDAFRGVIDGGDDLPTGVLLLYDTDAHLALTPPPPSAWMSVHPALAAGTMDAAQLGARADAMVRRVEAKLTHGTPQTP